MQEYTVDPLDRSIAMIGYVTLGTNDLPRAAKFYDALLGELGAKRFMEYETFIAWTTGPDKPGIGLTKPVDLDRGLWLRLGRGLASSLESGGDGSRRWCRHWQDDSRLRRHITNCCYEEQRRAQGPYTWSQTCLVPCVGHE